MKKILAVVAVATIALAAAPAMAQRYDTGGRLYVNAFQGTGAGAATSFWNFRVTDGTSFIPFPTALGGAGGLKVECISGSCGSSSFADAAAFTFGTTTVGVFAAVVDDVGTNTVAENSAGAPRMNTNRVLYVDLSKSVANTNAFLVTGTGGTFPVTGTFWQATQPVSGTFWQATQPVSGTFWQATQPVSGTVTVTDGAGALNVIVDSGTTAATQSGTWTVQPGNTANTTPWLMSIHDGTTKAAVFNLAANDPLSVAIVDGSGTQITTFGGGTQYTEADTDATITGTAMLWEDAADTLRAVSSAKPLPVNVVAGGTAGTQYTEDVAAAADPIGTALNLVRADAPAAVTTTDGDNIAARGTNKGELYVKHIDAIPVTDNAGSLTVDGTVTANAGSGTFVVGDGAGALNVIVDSSALPSGAATSANQSTEITALQKIDNLPHSGSDVALVEHAPVSAQLDDVATTTVTENNVAPLRITSARALHVAQQGTITATVSDGAGALNVIVDSGALTVSDGAGALNVIVDSSALPTGAATLAEQQTQTTSLQKIDNLAHSGSDVALSEHVPISGQFDDAATTTVTENNLAPVRITSARALHVAPQGTTTVAGTVTVTDGAGALNVIVDSGALTVSDGAGALNVIVDSSALPTGASTLAEQQSQTTHLATVAGAVRAEDVASADAHTGIPAMAVRKATPANTSGTDGDYENLQMSAGRLWTSSTVDAALPAGANAIGKLAANSGVDIGDVDVTSIAAGNNNIGDVDIASGTITTVSTVTSVTAVTTVGTITNPVSTQPTATASALNDGACVTVTTTSGTVVASNASRKFLALYARSTNTDIVYLKLGATATTSDFPLEVGQPFNITGDWVYTGVIDSRSATGSQSVCFVEF